MKGNFNNSRIKYVFDSYSKKKNFDENSFEKGTFKEKKSISQISTNSILDSTSEHYTLSKLISSVSNYRKESGSDFKLDLSSIKPSNLFHNDSSKNIGLSKFYSITPKKSFMSSSKFKNFSPLKNDANTSLANNYEINEEKVLNNEKKGIIDYFPLDKLIKMETKFINLLSKIKNVNQLREEYINWLNEFKRSPFYKFLFLFKNVFDNESPIKESVSSLINNSSYLLIISSILCFWITDKNSINNNNIIINNPNREENIDMKYIYELMINNHRLYLLLCLFILIESELIDNEENVYVLRLIEQIKAYLAKTLRNYKNRLLIIKEIKNISNKLINIINKKMKENNYYSQEILDYVNNLNKAEISRLFEIFELIKNRNYLNKNNMLKNKDENNMQNNKYYRNTNNNNENRNIYKEETKIKDYKNIAINPGLYIKKTVGRTQINNKKVTNKIINIIINNNNSDNNKDNKNHLYLNYNINKNSNFNNNSDNQNNNNSNMLYQNYNNYSGKGNAITINVNNNNNSYIDNSNYNKINAISLHKKLNSKYNLNKINKNFYSNYKNYNTLENDSNYNINNLYYNNEINPPQNPIQPSPPFLPPKKYKSKLFQKNLTLILDLDETLVRYNINENIPDEDNVIFRPGLFNFLNNVSPFFEIVIWTVATKEYADPIIDLIEKNKKYFIARLFREHATIKNNIYIKDLSNLGRDISKIIIVDDKETSFCLQKKNGILIKPFYGTFSEIKSDLILYDLFQILKKIILEKSKDVRQGIEKYQFEIKQKISKNFSKINDKNEENSNYNDKNILLSYINKNYSINNNNDFINRNSRVRKIKKCYTLNDSFGYRK